MRYEVTFTGHAEITLTIEVPAGTSKEEAEALAKERIRRLWAESTNLYEAAQQLVGDLQMIDDSGRYDNYEDAARARKRIEKARTDLRDIIARINGKTPLPQFAEEQP